MEVNSLRLELQHLIRNEFVDSVTGEVEVEWVDRVGTIIAFGGYGAPEAEDFLVVSKGNRESTYYSNHARAARLFGQPGALDGILED